eukprot:Awhi_evm1s14001
MFDDPALLNSNHISDESLLLNFTPPTSPVIDLALYPLMNTETMSPSKEEKNAEFYSSDCNGHKMYEIFYNQATDNNHDQSQPQSPSTRSASYSPSPFVTQLSTAANVSAYNMNRARGTGSANTHFASSNSSLYQSQPRHTLSTAADAKFDNSEVLKTTGITTATPTPHPLMSSIPSVPLSPSTSYRMASVTQLAPFHLSSHYSQPASIPTSVKPDHVSTNSTFLATNADSQSENGAIVQEVIQTLNLLSNVNTTNAAGMVQPITNSQHLHDQQVRSTVSSESHDQYPSLSLVSTNNVPVQTIIKTEPVIDQTTDDKIRTFLVKKELSTDSSSSIRKGRSAVSSKNAQKTIDKTKKRTRTPKELEACRIYSQQKRDETKITIANLKNQNEHLTNELDKVKGERDLLLERNFALEAKLKALQDLLHK